MAPVIDENRILDANGRELNGIRINPFLPNFFQPIATPKEGLSGKLVLLDEASMKTITDFSGLIGVVKIDRAPKGYDLSWKRYAQLGLKGVILTFSEGVTPDFKPFLSGNPMLSILPVNFLRAYADAGILQHCGQNVTIHLTQRFREVPNTSLVAFLQAAQPTGEALVVTGHYDSYCVLPSLPHGSMQAYSPATVLAMARAFSADRGNLSRDVIFVLDGAETMGSIGEASVISAFGPAKQNAATHQKISASIEKNAKELQLLERLLSITRSPGFFVDTEASLSLVDSLAKEELKRLNEELHHVFGQMVFSSSDQVLNRLIALKRLSGVVNSGPEYDAFMSAIGRENTLKSAISSSSHTLLKRQGKIIREFAIREKLTARFQQLINHLKDKQKVLEEDREINTLAKSYNAFFVLSPRLLPSVDSTMGESVAFVPSANSSDPSASSVNPQTNTLSTWMRRGQLEKILPEKLKMVFLSKGFSQTLLPSIADMPVSTGLWREFAYPAYQLVNMERRSSYQDLSLPDKSTAINPASMDSSLRFLGMVSTSFAKGTIPISLSTFPESRSYSGQVFAVNIDASVIPNFPVQNAIVGQASTRFLSSPRLFATPLLATDPSGRYELINTPLDLALGALKPEYSPQAFHFNDQGQIDWTKDHAEKTIYKSQSLPTYGVLDFKNVNLVLYRANPITFTDLTDPQTLRTYVSASLLSRKGLTPLARKTVFQESDALTMFAEPSEFFYVAMRSGTPDNPLVQRIRGFLLGQAFPQKTEGVGGINGQGYLSGDEPIFKETTFGMADSMLRTNTIRAELQERRKMLSETVSNVIEKSADLLTNAKSSALAYTESVLFARESAAYSLIAHPILLDNINGAVMSILWYLALLVPFTFFMEKLLFAFPDIRKQLAAQAVIFILVFAMLRFLHPAFELIRSSVMILLGFVILLISGGVTILFAGKFRENLAALEAMRGRAVGVGVNTMGIVVTSFMLGLNNMHRRKVRTGLTCATLVLITFAMIAFTSVQTDYVDRTTALGPASYQGLLFKIEQDQSYNSQEAFAIKQSYGSQFPISSRAYLTGTFNRDLNLASNPNLEITRPAENRPVKSTRFVSMLEFSPTEPLQSNIRLLTKSFWFKEQSSEASTPTVILSDRIAKDLEVSVEEINAAPEGVPVLINGVKYLATGIFNSQALNGVQDLDGFSILPNDITAIPRVSLTPDNKPILNPEDPRIGAENVVLTGSKLPTIPGANTNLASMVVHLDSLSYKEAKEILTSHLQKTGRPSYFGLDGVSYLGKIGRENSLQGVVDLIMPLVIAALTVLNTMKGSVYERKDEIYVYNAVGIAPRYIFFMFFTEAFVYSVIGTVLGYLLSQTAGFALTALNLTAGLNMTFAGPSTIVASLAVMGAVFFSTIFPARTALQIAAPSEDAGWKMPEPEGDDISFDLPFTFDTHDRFAVISFFHSFLEDHGEGGSGRFSASPPVIDVRGTGDDILPSVSATIWLKPYDLGVSQNLEISLPFDTDTGDFIARFSIRRITGTRESWVRLNTTLVVVFREQFLHWRAVSPAQKKDFFTKSEALFAEEVRRTEARSLEVSHV
ncbi:MAG: FtsX-like permease family protein [Spartobacteria bacterium]